MRGLSLFLLLLALGAAGAVASTIPIPGEGARITIPDDWKVLDRPRLAFVASTADETSAVGVKVVPNTGNEVISFDYVRGMAADYIRKAMADGATVKILNEGVVKLNGVPAGSMEFEEFFSGNRTVYSRVYNLAANGKLYQITLDTRDPFGDAGMKAIAESFRFDKAPLIAHHRMGLLKRRLIQFIVLIIVLVPIVWGIRRLVRRYFPRD